MSTYKKGYLFLCAKELWICCPSAWRCCPGESFGSIAVQRGFSWLEAQLFSAIIFGGAVQIVTVELIADNATLLTILFTAFVISARHFLYGLTLRKAQSPATALATGLGFLLTDELFALSGIAVPIGQTRLTMD